MIPVHVLLLPGVHMLDLAGPVQALFEANGFGATYRLQFVGEAASVRTAQGLSIAHVEALPPVEAGDWVLVPGTLSDDLDRLPVPTDWLRQAAACGARITSICSGAFALAGSGLLDGRQCTTHWKLNRRLQAEHPAARVLENRLFVCDGSITTSAGEASGIDLTLALVQEDFGARIVADVAREMVVYMRRSGESTQGSVYLDHRAHAHEGIHRVQDWIVAHPDQRVRVEDMAQRAALSPRHFTRLFKETTGVTLLQFAHKVKLETARRMVSETSLTAEQIALQCGFEDARQLRRMWRARFGTSIREERRHGRHRPVSHRGAMPGGDETPVEGRRK